MKKEFITTWSRQIVSVTSRQSLMRERFFDGSGGDKKEMIRPDDISFLELLPFENKKTKITIEVDE